MNHADGTDKALELLRDIPVEVTIEEVGQLVLAFPLLQPSASWFSHFNLNSILMTTAGTLILATSIHLFNATPAPVAVEPTVLEIVEPMAAIPEEAVVFTAPVEKKPEAVPQQPPQAPKPVEPPVAPPAPKAVIAVAAPDPMPTTVVIATTKGADRKESGTRQFDLKDFTGVKVMGSMEVVIAQGPFQVSAEGDGRVEQLNITVNDKLLVIAAGSSKGGKNNCEGSPTVLVSMPALERIELVGSGDVHLTEFTNMHNMTMDLRGSGDIHFANLKGLNSLTAVLAGSGDIVGEGAQVAGLTKIDLAGSGDVRLAGRTGNIEVHVVGSGDVDASEFEAGMCDVHVIGSGDVHVNCMNELKRHVTGSGEIHDSGTGGRSSTPRQDSY